MAAVDGSADEVTDECPADLWQTATTVDVDGPEVQSTFEAMIDAEVAMTSTLAVYELFVQGRPTRDRRTPKTVSAALPAFPQSPMVRVDSVTSGPPSWACRLAPWDDFVLGKLARRRPLLGGPPGLRH